MNLFSLGLPLAAPQTTGHSASLPADPPLAKPDSRVAAVSKDSASIDMRAGQDNRQPAPPSAMQRKITEILERQYEQLRSTEARAERKREAEAAAEAHRAVTEEAQEASEQQAEDEARQIAQERHEAQPIEAPEEAQVYADAREQAEEPREDPGQAST